MSFKSGKAAPVLVLFFLSLISAIRSSDAVMATLAIDYTVNDGTVQTMLASQAFFGPLPPEGAENNVARPLMAPPDDNPYLCLNVTTSDLTSWAGSTLLVPRGICTFEMKAYNAQKLGAKNIIIFGSLRSRYSLNATEQVSQSDVSYTTTNETIFPLEYYDYDCSNGEAYVPTSAIELEPRPYNADHNDPILSGTSETNLCRSLSSDHLSSCVSQACLLTGNYSSDGSKMQACCAWDLLIWLYADTITFKNSNIVTIPAAYVTLRQGNQLWETLKEQGQLNVTLYGRYRPKYNLSSVVIWMLGVFVAALSAYLSAGDYRWLIERTRLREENRGRDSQGRARSARDKNEGDSEGMLSQHRTEPPLVLEESLELNAWHAIAFIVMASSSLLILFYFKIYNVVKVLYGLGCSKAMSQIMFLPLLRKIFMLFNLRDKIVYRTNTEEFGDISILDIVSHLFGYTLGISWIYVCLTGSYLDENPFFWIMQDVMGACMCIIFLSVIKLNSIRVASILLIVAFFYDIFFVFISPIFFGNSVMITVATSGGPPTADPLWCEKYPSDPNCQGGDPLPMLFTIPRIFDYMGGASLLGLGDVVLPGLLLSFAARYDTAKVLMGIIAGGNGSPNNAHSCPEQKYCWNCGFCSGGYFPPLVVAYAVGLGMANVAVYLMDLGQPALLYLVPCCLGTMIFMGWRRNELQGLWEGPRVVRSADSLLFGELSNAEGSGHQLVSTEERNEPPTPLVPSAEEDGGDIPFLSSM